MLLTEYEELEKITRKLVISERNSHSCKWCEEQGVGKCSLHRIEINDYIIELDEFYHIHNIVI